MGGIWKEYKCNIDGIWMECGCIEKYMGGVRIEYGERQKECDGIWVVEAMDGIWMNTMEHGRNMAENGWNIGVI